MPIYEYQCVKCHHYLEALQKMTDKPLRECPECGKHTLKRLVSAPMFRLAGSGWYETDFKSDQETKRNLAGKDEAPAAEAAAPAKTDKAETTTDKKPEAVPAGSGGTPRKPAARPGAKAKPRPLAKKSAPKKAARKR
jgi:putative FmdB family regulatory protein